MSQPSLHRDSPISKPDHLAGIEELRRSYDCLPLAVYVNDAPNRCIYINPAYRDMFGSDVSIWKPSLVDDDTKKETEAKRLRLWATGEPYAATGRVVTSTGSQRHASGQVIPVFDSAGQVVRVIGVIIDVTEEVEATAALEEREQQARALVANAADAMVGIDSAHRIRVWNKAAEDTFGYMSEEIIGQSLSRLLPADARPGHPSLVQAFAESSRGRELMNGRAVKALLRDGTEISVEIGLSKVRLGDDQLAVATIRDVSRREELKLQQDHLHARYKALIQHARDPIFIADKDGDIVYVSPAITDVFGHDPEDVVGWSVTGQLDSIHPDDHKTVEEMAATLTSAPGTHKTFTYRRLHRDGHWLVLETQVTNYLDVEGLNGVVFNMRDITAEVAVKAQLQTRNEELQAVLEAVPDQMFRVSVGGRVAECLTPDHDGFEGGITLEGRQVHELFPPEFGSKLMATIKDVSARQIRASFSCNESDLGLTGGSSFEFRVSALPGDDVLVAVRDATPQIRTEEQLTYQALHDGLTGLPNRVMLARELQTALEDTALTAGQVGVLFLDLDGFKQVNDTFGHPAGDGLLIEVARRIRSAVRPGDIVARLGGDEFVIMCAELQNEDAARALAERIHMVLRPPITIGDDEATISTSVGIALAHPGGEDAETLIAHADAAMYRAKDLGRARAEIFDPSLRRTANKRVDLEADLRSALSDGELDVCFQPTVDATTHEVVGLEAVPNWTHPLYGPIAAKEFTSIAERSGLIIDLDQAILRSTVSQVLPWASQTPGPCTVTVGVSEIHLARGDMARDVLAVLGEISFPPDSLCLRLDEGAIVGLEEQAIENLASLARAGVGLMIDQFGLEQTSINALRSLPATQLKLHPALTGSFESASHHSDMVSAAVDLAHQLGLDIAAEGVETQEQMDALTSLGCDTVQGNFIAPPLCAEDLAEIRPSNRRWINR